MKCNPCIEYLEIFALAVGVELWINHDSLRNKRMILFCNNMSVVDMINQSSSSCPNCMVLIRRIVLLNSFHNVRVFAMHIRSAKDILADALSRNQMQRFWRHAPPDMRTQPETLLVTLC